MVDRIRTKRGKLPTYDGYESALPSCPFTPANSFVESNMEQLYNEHNLSDEVNSELLIKKLKDQESRVASSEDDGGRLTSISELPDNNPQLVLNDGNR